MAFLHGVEITIETGNAIQMDCDVLALKYAQGLHGADRQAVALLSGAYPMIEDELPLPSGFRTYASPLSTGPLVEVTGLLAAHLV